MALRSLFLVAMAVVALLNVGFASDDNDMPLAYSDVEPYETSGQLAKKSLRGHSSRTGFDGIEDWRDCLLDPETETAREMLDAEEDIKEALDAFRTATTDELMADLAKACIQATVYGSPRGAAALIIIADYMEKNGTPTAFLDLYTQLTNAVCEQPINLQKIKEKLQELPKGIDTDERLFHMALLGNTVAADCFWQRIPRKEEWLKPWNELEGKKQATIQRLSEFGSKIFQGLHAHAIYNDSSLESTEKMDLLDKQMVNDFAPADDFMPVADYLTALRLEEIEADPEKMNDQREWGELIKDSDWSPYGRRLLADILQRRATPAFMQAMTDDVGLELSNEVTPYQILRELARSRKKDDWYIKAALCIASAEGEWAEVSSDHRWGWLKVIAKENPIVIDVIVQSLNARDEKSSMGWSVAEPEERFKALEEVADDGSDRAHELYEQIALSATSGLSNSDLPDYFQSNKTREEWMDVIEGRAIEAGSRPAQEFMLERRSSVDKDLWRHLFDVATIMSSANDGASTRYDALVGDAR